MTDRSKNSRDVAEQLLDKVRAFAQTLDDDERELFAALVGPGVALAHRELDDVEGFASTWEPKRLPDRLAEVVRTQGIRVIGI
jgi:hypothetical protein